MASTDEITVERWKWNNLGKLIGMHSLYMQSAAVYDKSQRNNGIKTLFIIKE